MAVGSRGETHGFLDTVSLAFLARRLHNRRVRASAVRDLKGVPPPPDAGWRSDRDRAADCLEGIPAWPADDPAAPSFDDTQPMPRLSIVIMAVGSRGDVQPFIPIAARLAQRHRVRVATHREFRAMVEQAGLEFYPLAGDPHVLMEYMVKTGGRVIPTRLDQIVEDVPKKRAMIADILASNWRACTEPDPDRAGAPPFRADVVLANPPSYGHIHCAEALHVPLHVVFTMPWNPTCAYPHPFAHLAPGQNRPVLNFLSYGMMDLLIWGGIGDLVNAFRRETLGLAPVTLVDGAALLEDHEVPFTYLWPASLVPKPADWGPHIDLTNFIFHDQAHAYQPPGALLDFLAAGEAPIYVGFGSVRVDDPGAVTRTIFSALDKAGARAILSNGWAHLGGEAPPPNVFVIGDSPHDWLFPRCRAVCHHGGAGTTAAGLRAGLPTVVVPSFGDQFFWGQVVAEAGAGPQPIPMAQLDDVTLAEAFAACRQPLLQERARALGARLAEIDGVSRVVQSVYRQLPWHTLRCANDPRHLATLVCDTCGGVSLCRDCSTAHPGHPMRPSLYVDWSARPVRGVVTELGELMGDVARALQAGLDELLPRLGSG
jgi:UDP:flavonoid glycosyltransferase YjiC (YdhE family)